MDEQEKYRDLIKLVRRFCDVRDEMEEFKKGFLRSQEKESEEEVCDGCKEDMEYSEWDLQAHEEMKKISEWATQAVSGKFIKPPPQHENEVLNRDLYVSYYTRLYYETHGFGDE